MPLFVLDKLSSPQRALEHSQRWPHRWYSAILSWHLIWSWDKLQIHMRTAIFHRGFQPSLCKAFGKKPKHSIYHLHWYYRVQDKNNIIILISISKASRSLRMPQRLLVLEDKLHRLLKMLAMIHCSHWRKPYRWMLQPRWWWPVSKWWQI